MERYAFKLWYLKPTIPSVEGLVVEETIIDLNYQVYANQHFVIKQCRNCSVLGYLIVRPVKKVVCLTQLDKEALGMLGSTLALAVAAVREVIKPLKIYCAQFGEENGQLHFHVFPRTK